jgi:hypothetical protein
MTSDERSLSIILPPPHELSVYSERNSFGSLDQAMLKFSGTPYIHLNLNLGFFFVDAISEVKLGNLTRVLRSSDFEFLGDYSRNLENSSPEFLLRDRKN